MVESGKCETAEVSRCLGHKQLLSSAMHLLHCDSEEGVYVLMVAYDGLVRVK